MNRIVKLPDVERELRILYAMSTTPEETKRVIDSTITLINNLVEFTSNVLNVVSNTEHRIDYSLIDLKGMDRLIKLNEKYLISDIQKEIDNLERKF